MGDDYKHLIGAWLDAVGATISAIAESRELIGLNSINNRLITIGEGIQSMSSSIMAIATTDEPINSTGNWIIAGGTATSSLAAYLQDIEDVDENIRLEVIGDSIQTMGAAISSLYYHFKGDDAHSIGNALRGLGAGLEAIGGVHELKENKEIGQILLTIGAIILAIGSNLYAAIKTIEVTTKNPEEL